MRTRNLINSLVCISLALFCAPVSGDSPDLLRSNLFLAYQTIYTVAFSPDGLLIGAGARTPDPRFGVFRVSDLAPVLGAPYGFGEDALRPSSISFADDGTMAAYGTAGGAASIGGIPPAIAGLDLSGDDDHEGNAVAFSPTKDCSRWVISAGAYGIRRSRVFCSGAGWASDTVVTIGGLFFRDWHDGLVSALLFSGDGKSFYLGTSEGTVQTWQVEPPQLLWQTNFPNNYVSGIDLLANGRQIVTLLSNTTVISNLHTLRDTRLWEVGQTNWLQVFRGLPVISSTLTSDGRYLFLPLVGPRDLPYNPDYYTNELTLWRVSDGRLMVRYDEDLPEVQQAAVAPDGRTFAYGRGDGIVALARMPLLIDAFSRSDNELVLRWQGGSGLYQLQHRSNLTSGDWQNVSGPTTDTSATNSIPQTNLFYRVQSLPNP